MTAWQTADKAIADLCTLAEELQITPREKFDGEDVAAKLWAVAHTLERDPEAEHIDPESVISALRLAEVATEDADKFRRVVGVILTAAPPTPDEDTGGVRLLVDLQAAGELTFEVA